MLKNNRIKIDINVSRHKTAKEKEGKLWQYLNVKCAVAH